MEIPLKFSALLASLFLASPLLASPVTYEIKFDGSVRGQVGTGSFVWDPEILTLSDLYLDFGPDKSGLAVGNSLWHVNLDESGLNFGTWFYMVITGDQVVQDHVYGYDAIGFGGDTALEFFSHYNWFNLDYWNVSYRSDWTEKPYSYDFFLSSNPFGPNPDRWAGTYSVSVRHVPEPASLALLFAGLLGVRIARKIGY